MSTSLREQLQRLAVPQTTALADVRSRASILFDRKEAATKNRRTIYELGCSGLQELIALNSSFQQFQLTLFNEATVDLERAVEQSDVNKLLDRNIRKFLQHLSPYFLLRPAHMCLEWLLRRFQVHEYNRADLLALCLPYHETNAFVRVLQTLRIRKTDAEWDWLRPLQKPGLSLPKSTIVNRAASNVAFFKFVCVSTLSAVRELGPRAHLLQSQLNFYATVVVGAWEHAAAIEEWHITTVLPSLLHALSSQIVDFVSAAFIIVAQLVRRTQLTPKLCNSVLARVAAVPYESLRATAVLLLIWIFDTQQAAQAQYVSKTLIQQKWLTAQLATLVKDDKIAIHTLCMPLVQNCVAAIQTGHADAQACKEFLERLICDVSFPDITAQHIISCFLRSYVAAAKPETNAGIKQLFENDVIELDSDDDMTDVTDDFHYWYSKFLHKLESQYPNAFDQTIKQALKSKLNDSSCFQQALKMALGYRLKSSDENATDIYGSLYHYNAQIRLCAIKELFANLNNYQRKTQNDQLLRECLADRLGDDSDLVVAEVLKLPTKYFIDILGCGKFAAALFGILHKSESGDNAWFALTLNVVQHLTAEHVVQNYDANLILLALMPLLFPDNNLSITRDAIAAILQSALSKKIPFLQELKLSKAKNKQNDFNAIEFKKQFINITSASSATPDVLKLFESVAGNANAKLFENAKHFSHFLLLVTACLKKKYQAEQSLRMLEFISSFYKRFQIKHITECSKLSAECISLQLFADFILTIIKHTQFSSKSLLDWSEHESTTTTTAATELNCFLCIFNLLASEALKTHENAQQQLEWTKTLKEAFDAVLPTAQAKIEFLTNFYLYEQYTAVKLLNADTHYSVLRLRAFKLTSAILRNKQHNLQLNTELIIKICIALSAQEDILRLQALQTLKDIEAHVQLEEHLQYFVTALLKRSAELSMDAEQYPLILFVILQTMKKKNHDMASKVLKNILLLLKQQASTSTSTLKNAVFTAELLKMLKHINDEHILSELLVLASTALRQAVPNKTSSEPTAMFILQKPYSDIYQLIIERFDMQTVANVLLQQPLAWQLLEQSFSQYQVFIINADKLQPVPCIVLETLNEHIYSSMPKKYQTKLVKLIIKTIAQAENDSIGLSANKLLKKCELNCEPFVEVLENMSKTADNKTESPEKQRKSLKKRLEHVNDRHNISTPAWKEGVVLLEILQNKKKLYGSEHMIAALFELLRICREIEEQTAVEYTKQLTLSALLHCCQKSKAAGIDLQQQLPKSISHIDQIVQCMRATQNPQTHNHALLLLTHCAELFPQQVLHNMVGIFSFMGSSVMRHDDAFSFQIINNIIDSIIPILVQSNSTSGVLTEKVIPVLKVFSAIMFDVPEHRRLPLYTKLLHTLGTEQYLWSFLCIVFEAHVINDENLRLQKKKAGSGGSEGAVEKISQRLEIALQLVNSFTPAIIFETCIQLMHYIKQLPMTKESKQQQQTSRKSLTPANGTELTLFDVKCHSAKQLCHYKYTIMQFISSITRSNEFLRQIAALTPADVLELKPFYQNFIIKLLSYVPLLNKAIEKAEPAEVSQIKFWKALLHRLHDVLDNVISLLSADMFLVVVAGLMQHQLLSIRKRVIEVLINKLQQRDAFFDDCEQQNICNLLKPLSNIISSILQRDEAISGTASSSNSSTNELIFIQQSALIAIKLLSKLFALKYIAEFKSLLAQLTKTMKHRANVSRIILATVVLSMIELSSNLKAHSLAYLPKYMPQLIEVLQEQASILHHQAPDNVCIALITGIQKLVDSLPLFLGPYMVDIITALSTISNCITTKYKENDKDQRSALALHKLTATWTRLANEVPARILVPSCEQAYDKLMFAQNYADIAVLMKLLATAISSGQTADLLGVQAELSNFFLHALEFRISVQVNNYTPELIDDTEAIILEAFVSWILKLSEGSFRPLFGKIYEWAFKRTAQRQTILTFFLLSNKIAEALKSLFLLFAGDFIEDAAKLLNENNTLHSATDALSISLLKGILNTLFNVFLYDSKGFITAHRFDILMQPIVDQLENKLVLQDDSVQQVLTACIAQLAVTVSNDVLWKQLNYQVLLKTRSNVAEVRMLAFNNCVEIARKLGDDFTPLLPETVPFIAELFEDENPIVEKHTRKSVQNLESILGESIQKYL